MIEALKPGDKVVLDGLIVATFIGRSKAGRAIIDISHGTILVDKEDEGRLALLA